MSSEKIQKLANYFEIKLEKSAQDVKNAMRNDVEELVRDEKNNDLKNKITQTVIKAINLGKLDITSFDVFVDVYEASANKPKKIKIYSDVTSLNAMLSKVKLNNYDEFTKLHLIQDHLKIKWFGQKLE